MFRATSVEGGVAGDCDVFYASSLLVVVLLRMIGGAGITNGGGGGGRKKLMSANGAVFDVANMASEQSDLIVPESPFSSPRIPTMLGQMCNVICCTGS